jgi:hypothetical protein
MQEIVDEAVAAYEAALFWDRFTEGYERLAGDNRAWAELQAERRGEEPALGDGLDRR